MTEPADALWLSVDVYDGEVEMATIMVTQKAAWTIDGEIGTYHGYFC